MFIKRPGNGRASYSLVGSDGKTLHDERVDNVNRDLRMGMSRDILEERMRVVLFSFKRRPELDADNIKLANACHEYKVKRKGRHLSRPATAKQRLLRAAHAMGRTSLLVATEEVVVTQLEHVPFRSRYQVIGAVNELLAFAKRGITLFNPQPRKTDEIAFIRISQWEGAATLLVPHHRAFLGALFATGCRIGELPRAVFRSQSAYVATQLLRDGKVGPTKNRTMRVAPLIMPLAQYVTQLQTYGQKEIDRIRLEEESDMRNALRLVFGITTHDLRHSYCVEHGAVGANVHELADYIGDTVSVCQRHYRPYCLQDEQVARAAARWPGST